MGDRKINFSWYADGISIDGLKFSIDPFDLYSATDFYLIDGSIEKDTRPEVYFFHELVHLYHYLTKKEDVRKTPSLPENLESEFKEHFPNEDDDGHLILDFEELKTITGLPVSEEEKNIKQILCENSYRAEKNFSYV